MTTRSPEYYRVLASDRWHALRLEVLRRDHFRCGRCGARRHLDVHHARGYARLGHERASELETLCRSCHDARHGRGGTAWWEWAVVILGVLLVVAFHYWRSVS